MRRILSFSVLPSAEGFCTTTHSTHCEHTFSYGSKAVFISLLFALFFSGGVLAQVTNGFELDGNATSVIPNPPDDWDLINSGTSHAQVTTGIVLDLPPGNDNAFQQGSADINDIPTWHWTLFTTPDKDDILHAGAALYNNTQIFFFGDRYATNGDAQIGFWFFKNAVGPNPDGSFYGTHAIGDILLLSDFVNGGGVSVIKAYEWVGSGGSDGALNLLNVNGNNLYAIVNSSNQSSPWNFVPKTGPANVFGPGAFYEGGIDLAGLGGSINSCFTSFLLETRSSQSLTAELKDFVFGNFFTQPQVTVNSASMCPGGNPVTLTATVAGGSAPLTYSWSNGATTSSITVSPSVTTTYTVVVTAANGCVANPASGTVTVNTPPPCSIGSISPGNLICNHGNYTISTTATGTLSWSMSVDGNPTGWAIVGSNTGQTITFSAGNCGTAGFLVHFTLTVTDAQGCTSTCNASFAPGAPACNVSIRPPIVLTCASTSQYILTSYATGILNPTFSWTVNGSPIGAGINDGSGLDSILVTVPGTYQFVVHDAQNSANDCFASVTVIQNVIAPGAQATGGELTCAQTSVQLSANSSTGGVTYNWSGPNGFTSAQQNPTVNAAGNYTVTVTNPVNSCTSTATVTVTQNIAAPGVTAAGGELSCAVTSIQINASSLTSGVTYNWTGPNGFSSSQQNPMVNVPGMYTVTVTNPANGCASMATVTVTQNIAAPGVTATGAELTCAVTSIQINASSLTSGVTYSWTGPGGFSSNSQTPTVSLPGMYTVTVTNPANGCISTATATVTQNITAPGVTAAGGELTCAITFIHLTANSTTSGVSYSWTGPNGFSSSQQNPMINVAGTYTVVVTNPANGCTSMATATITQNITPPGVTATGGTLNCIVSSVQLMASSPTNGVSYMWSGPGGFTSTLYNPVVTGPGMYTVVVTSPVNGCTSYANALVVQNIIHPTAQAAGGELTCATTSVQLSASSLTSGVSYNWSGPNGFSSSQQNPMVNVAGTYTVTVTNPANGCTASAMATVTQNIAVPGVTASGGVLNCITTSVHLNANSPTSGVSYSWIGPGGFISSLSNPVAPGPGLYTVVVTNPDNGCTSSSIAVVIQNTVHPGAYASGGQLTCSATSVQLHASSIVYGVSYSWAGPNGFSSSQQYPVVSDAGIYVVTVTNLFNGCTSVAMATVTTNTAAPGAQATGGQLTCASTSAQLAATSSTSGVAYSWTGPNGFSSSQQNPVVTDAGTYTVMVTNPANGCTSVATTTVTSNIIPPGAQAAGGQITCTVTSAQLTASSPTGGVVYSWSGPNGFTSTQQNPIVSDAGTYTVVITNPANGCTSAATATIIANTAAPGVGVIGGQLNCGASSVQLVAYSQTGGVTFSWIGPNGFYSTQQNPIVNVAGTYTVTVTNPANGCTSSASVTVTQSGSSPSCYILPPSYPPYCGTPGHSLSVTASGGTGPYAFSWSVSGTGWTITAGGNTNQITYTSGLAYNAVFTVVVTDANGCTSACSRMVGCQTSGRPGDGNASGTISPFDDVTLHAYPNPFENNTTIEFTFNAFSADAQVEVYSMNGTRVTTLFKGEAMQDVKYKTTFDASNYAEGIYFCRVSANDNFYYLKLLVMKQ